MQGTWSFALLCLGICPDWYHINTADSHAWHNYVADGYCWTDMTVRPPVHIRYCRCCNWDCVQRILQPAMPALSLSCSLICKLCIWVCICMHVEYKAQRKSQKSLRDCINIELPKLQWKAKYLRLQRLMIDTDMLDCAYLCYQSMINVSTSLASCVRSTSVSMVWLLSCLMVSPFLI